jgi:hypothetical protein
MKLFVSALLVYCCFLNQHVYCQTSTFDKVKFFKDETTVNVTLETYWGKLIKQKNKIGNVFPARFISKLPDGTNVNEKVDLIVRGHFRRDYCYIPPLKLTFKKDTASVLAPLKSIKLVNTCKLNSGNEQNLLKEYLIYKIYNLITDKSIRVRLLNIEYKDSAEKKSDYTGPAFLTEDVKDMAKRNECIEFSKGKVMTEATSRKQMTIVALFEYMIGNTDWSVPGDHNIKLIQLKSDSTSRPFPVAYDFDYSGLVNTDYAIPDAMFNTESVQQRVYRGFPRSMEELEEALLIFKAQKENIVALINGFEPLSASNKKGMISYLQQFYTLIDKPKEVKSIFIDNARKE